MHRRLYLDRHGPAAVVRAATRDAAEAIGLGREVGSLEAGKQADLLLVHGDPTTDITALKRVREVFIAGRHIAR